MLSSVVSSNAAGSPATWISSSMDQSHTKLSPTPKPFLPSVSTFPLKAGYLLSSCFVLSFPLLLTPSYLLEMCWLSESPVLRGNGSFAAVTTWGQDGGPLLVAYVAAGNDAQHPLVFFSPESWGTGCAQPFCWAL